MVAPTACTCPAVQPPSSGMRAATAEALRHHERLGMPFERARTLLVEGRILRRLRRKKEARTALEEAAREFERLGAAAWQARADSEVRRTATRRAPP